MTTSEIVYLAARAELARRRRLLELKAECEADLLAFGRAFWHILEPATPFVSGWLLRTLCDLLMAITDGYHQRVIINIPPGTGKSLWLNVLWCAWEWGPQNMAHLRYISASYMQGLPERDNIKFSRLINSAEYQELWGDRVKLRSDGMELVENARTGWKRVTSTGGATTGHRGDRILIDDANNPKTVESDTIRESTKMWLTEIMPDRLNNLATGVIINLQQRTNEGDATAVLCEMWGGSDYTWMMVPMEFDPLRNTPVVLRWDEEGRPIQVWRDPRGLDENGVELEGLYRDENGTLKIRMGSPMAQAEGELCWSDRYPPDTIPGLKKSKGTFAWSGQYQQALALDTKIPTPRGFVAVKDLSVGDYVFGSDGKATAVTGKSEVFRNRPLYRVKSDDGAEVICDADHLWTVQLRLDNPTLSTLRTEVLANRQVDREIRFPEAPRRPRIPEPPVWDLASAVLPADPWALGAWLGDGDSGSTTMNAHDDDASFMRAEFERRGYSTSDRSKKQSFGVTGKFRGELAAIGVLEKKSIPDAYLWASYDQRIQLLQGLMDTDGSVSRGRAAYATVKPEWVRQASQLILSLGAKPFIRRFRMNSRLPGGRVSTLPNEWCYKIEFYLPDCCRMPRKRDMLRGKKNKHGRFLRFELCGEGDTQCITIANSDGLFLAGEGALLTHNSPTVRGGGIIRTDWWQTWNDPTYPTLGTVIGSLDTAIKEGEQNDFNAFTSWGAFAGQDGAPKLLLTSAWQVRCSLAELVRRTAESCFEQHVDYLLIEDKARGHDVAAEIVRQYQDATWETILIPANGRGAFSGDKRARLEAVSVMFSGDVKRVAMPTPENPGATMDVWSGGMIFAPYTDWAEEVINDVCLVAGSMVIGSEGVIPIEEVMPGDMVLTHLGRFRPVLRTAKRVVQGTIALHAKTLDTLRLTEDHPIWGCWIDKYRETDGPWWMLAGKVVSRVYKEVIRDGAVRSEANQDAHTAATLIFPVRENPIAEIDFREWVTLLPTKDNEIFESEDFLTSSHVATGWINWRQLLDYAFGRVVGLYLAEGCCSRAAVTWAFNARTEQHLVDEITAFLSDRIGVRTRVREASNCFSVTCSLALLYDFFAGFGRGARVKYLPSWIWDAPDEFLRGVLSGWAEGDGYEWGGKIRGTTSSRSLVWHMRLMMLRLGIESNIVVRPSPGLVTIKGRLTQTHEAYEISWQIDGNKLTAAIPIEGGRAYSIMRRENLSEEIEVFNIEVMEDKSYVTTGGTVHNCGFPGRAHDDLVDSTTTALSFARRHGVVVRKVEHEAAEYQRKLYRRTPKMPYAIT